MQRQQGAGLGLLCCAVLRLMQGGLCRLLA